MIERCRGINVVFGVLAAGLALFLQGCRTEPVCILPPRHSFEIAVQQVPNGILNVFREAFGDSRISRAELYLAGDRLVFYVFRFEKDGEFREVLIAPTGELRATYRSD